MLCHLCECHMLALYFECRYTKCRYTECLYADCRGAEKTSNRCFHLIRSLCLHCLSVTFLRKRKPKLILHFVSVGSKIFDRKPLDRQTFCQHTTFYNRLVGQLTVVQMTRWRRKHYVGQMSLGHLVFGQKSGSPIIHEKLLGNY
jgi:hypothetical protein